MVWELETFMIYMGILIEYQKKLLYQSGKKIEFVSLYYSQYLKSMGKPAILDIHKEIRNWLQCTKIRIFSERFMWTGYSFCFQVGEVMGLRLRRVTTLALESVTGTQAKV